jgi:hypothetical protein
VFSFYFLRVFFTVITSLPVAHDWYAKLLSEYTIFISNGGNALELLRQTYSPKKPDVYGKSDSNLAHLCCF